MTPTVEISEGKIRGRWRKNYRLGDGCSIKHGFAFKGALMTTDGSEELPIVVNIVNFQYTGGFRFDSTKIQRYTGPFPHDYILKPGDVLVVMTCQTPKGEILGVPGRIPKDGRAYLHNQRLGLACVKDPGALDIGYLYYLFLSSRFNAHLFGTATGAKILHTAPSRIEDYRFDCPPISVQRKVAGFLSAYDDLIENNTRRIRVLEEMAQAIYREWFVYFRFPGHKTVKLVPSTLGPIPEGWQVQTLEEVCERITDGSHRSPKSVGDGYPMASVKDMHEWGLNVEGCRKIGEEDYQQLVANSCRPLRDDILVAKDGSYLKHIFVVGEERDLVVLSSIAILRPSGQVLPHLLAMYLKDPSVKARMKGYVSGVAIPRIVLKDFRRFAILAPPLDLQRAWYDVAGPMINRCYYLVVTNQNLRRTRDLLLPKLISGELDVSDLDINVGDAAA